MIKETKENIKGKEENIKLLNELLEQAKKIDEIASERLNNALEMIPMILKRSEEVGFGGICLKQFEQEELDPFLTDFAIGLSEATTRIREIIGTEAYLSIRRDVLDYMLEKVHWGECIKNFKQLDFLFESWPDISTRPPNGYHYEVPIIIIAGLKMFSLIKHQG